MSDTDGFTASFHAPGDPRHTFTTLAMCAISDLAARFDLGAPETCTLAASAIRGLVELFVPPAQRDEVIEAASRTLRKPLTPLANRETPGHG